VMDALQHELALSLHGVYMLRRMLVQDAQRKVLVRRLLAAGEEERRRIARELHDEISQLLTVIQLSLEHVGNGEDGELAKVKHLLRRTQKEIHRIIYDLRPSLLDDLGLAAAVKWYAASYLEPAGTQVSLEVDEELDLPDEIEITTFRIYQEIITNILRHSQADRVSIELYARGGRLVLAVEDDGVGFDPAEKVEGAGLVGIRERAALVGGTVDIDSEPSMGAHVQLQIPLA
jgi:signal transduction histidine kinase